MNSLLRLLIIPAAGYFASRVAKEMNISLAPVGPMLRKMGLGVLMILISVIAWFGAIFFLLASLFFYLSQYNQYLAPALWTGIIALGLGLYFVFFGISLLRRPK